MDTQIATKYGSVSLEKLVAVYERHKEHDQKNAERRHEYNQTEEGKQKNRERAKAYYETHRVAMIEKRKEAYHKRKAAQQMQAEGQ